jgi:hypothetical protein
VSELAYPHNKFNPYDPNHVTLQLIQETHSMRIQMQLDRDEERRKRRELVGEVARLRLELTGANEQMALVHAKYPDIYKELFENDNEE